MLWLFAQYCHHDDSSVSNGRNRKAPHQIYREFDCIEIKSINCISQKYVYLCNYLIYSVLTRPGFFFCENNFLTDNCICNLLSSRAFLHSFNISWEFTLDVGNTITRRGYYVIQLLAEIILLVEYFPTNLNSFCFFFNYMYAHHIFLDFKKNII